MRQVTASDSRALGEIVERRSGLRFGGSRAAALLASAERAMAAAGATTVDDYRRLLERDARAFDDLVTALTVGETYFFRERKQFDLLREVIVPEAAARRGPGQMLQVWSAGCSTGEEAYSLAMVLEEAAVAGRVVGTDVSRAALARAEKGVYGKWSLRGLAPGQLDPYLVPIGGGRFRVRDSLASRVAFAPRNLIDGPPRPSRFDVVFCRNVLIYLTPGAIEQVLETLVRSLVPGGWLITASSDPHLDREDLERVRTPHGIAYRRRPRVLPVTGAATPAAAAPISPSGRSLPPVRPIPAPVVRTRGREQHLEPQPLSAGTGDAPATAGNAGAPGDHARLVRALAGEGRTIDALAASEEGALAHPLDAELHYLRALLYLGSGRPADAAAAAEVSVYLQSDLAVAHVLRAQAARRLGDAEACERSFRNARRLLASMTRDAPVALGDGEEAGRLLAAVDAQLDQLLGGRR